MFAGTDALRSPAAGRRGASSRPTGAGGEADGEGGSRPRHSGAGASSARPLFAPLRSGPLKPLAGIPSGIQPIVALLGAIVALALGAAGLGALRSRRADSRRRALLDDIGLLQTALLPPVPDRVGGVRASVAYRPWEGPGAGGDFYDVFALPGGCAGVVLGDVEGHGSAVIGHTAALRHTLRAYLEAGLEPRAALELAGAVFGREVDNPLATAILAVHDPRAGTLSWAGAGHPPPILLGPDAERPVTAASAPPLGAGAPTGLRQTTVSLGPGSVACLYTDGLAEAPTRDGRLGYERLTELAEELGDGLTGPALLDRVRTEATQITDDMAVCVLRPASDRVAGPVAGRLSGRVEELAVPAGQVSTSLLQRFLWACGIESEEAVRAIESARELDRRRAGVLLRIETEGHAPVQVSELAPATLAPVG